MRKQFNVKQNSKSNAQCYLCSNMYDLQPREDKSIASDEGCLNSKIIIQLIWKTTKFYFGITEGNLEVNILYLYR